MVSKYIHHINLEDALSATRAFRANNHNTTHHLKSAPPEIATAIINSLSNFAEHPDLSIFGKKSKKITAKDLAILIDEVLASVWEAIPNTRIKPSNRNPRALPIEPENFKYTELSGSICNEGPALDALLFYKLDKLCGFWVLSKFDDALSLLPEILTIQRDIGEREGRKFSGVMMDLSSSYDARQRAVIRHSDTNQQKITALREWDLHGDKVSSMAAFARSRHKEFGVTERTLYDWIREHRKAIS